MSDFDEIKKRLGSLTQLGKSLPQRLMGLKGPEGEAMKKKAKEEGTRLGIGVGISLFGAIIAALALLYSLAVVILLVNIALDRLWLSALIVVGGFLLIGAGIVAGGAAMARAGAKGLSGATGDLKKQMKDTSEEMKTEVEGLQKQVAELAKKTAPVYGPVAVGSYLVYRLLKRASKSRKEKRRILRVIETYEEARAEE